MKQIYISLFLVMVLAILFSCNKSGNLNYTDNGNWVSRASFPGIAMGAGASFSINNIAYVGTGINPLTPYFKLNSMYKYTAAADTQYGVWVRQRLWFLGADSLLPGSGPQRCSRIHHRQYRLSGIRPGQRWRNTSR